MFFFYHLSPFSSLIVHVANIISLIHSFTCFKIWYIMLLNYSVAGSPVYELSLIEYGICIFTLLLNLLLILFVNVQHWCHEKLLLMVRLMVLEATTLLSSVVLLPRPQRLAQISSHYQISLCYLCQYMSHMLTVEILIADSFLSGLNFTWCVLFIDILLHGVCCFCYVRIEVFFMLFIACIHSN